MKKSRGIRGAYLTFQLITRTPWSGCSKSSGVRPVKPRAPGAGVSTRSGTDLGFCVRESVRAGRAGLLGPPDLCGEGGATPWTLAASVPQAGIDYDAWSRHRGNPHAYPPICFRTCSTSIKVQMAPIRAFSAPFDWGIARLRSGRSRKGAGLNRSVIPGYRAPEMADRQMSLPSAWPARRRRTSAVICAFSSVMLVAGRGAATASPSCGYRTRSFAASGSFRLLVAYPRKIPPVTAP
jgi:hypothetical protein